ncbi:tetratricopeptide repeat [Brachionus plicatilis]|uniref:Tetratricopeptide repeat n=1 Tax=Brachionus plicatilis TaxID=10195 RepID=A0A3M7TA91_BRAPC|nr:tetratricopeptide repeat [Brachionus plicatilis]
MYESSMRNGQTSNIPPRKVPFIGSITNNFFFDQLDKFINNEDEKILVLCNHESITEQPGIGKKSFAIEYSHGLKTKFNIKWISAKSDAQLSNEFKKFNSKLLLNARPKNANFKSKDLYFLYDANESNLIEKNISKINFSTIKIIIISNSAFFKLSKYKVKYLKVSMNFTQEDLKSYFSHFRQTKYLNQNDLVRVISIKNFRPFLLPLLVRFVEYNNLVPFGQLFRHDAKFDLNFLFEFLNNLNRISLEICKVFSYVDHECVPQDLLVSTFKLSWVKMQIPLNILVSLGIVEKSLRNKNLCFKMHEYFINDLNASILANESADDELFLRKKIAKSLHDLLPHMQKRDLTRMTKADIYFSSMEKYLNFLDFKNLSAIENEFAKVLIQLLEKYVQFSHNNIKDDAENLIKYSFIYYEMKKFFQGDQNICEVIKIGNFLASIYFDNGLYGEALKIHGEIKEFNFQIYTSDSLEIAKNFFNLAHCHFKMYNYSWALYFFKDSLNIRLKLLGDRIDPEMTDTIFLIGICYLKINNLKKAYLYHKRAYQMRVKLFGNCSLRTADSMNCLGECNFRMKIYKEAKTFYEKSYQFRAKIADHNDPATIETLINLAQVLIVMKEWKRVWEILNKKIHTAKSDSRLGIKVSYLKGLCLIENGQTNEALIHLVQGFHNHAYTKQLDKEIKLDLLNSMVDSFDKFGQKSKSEEYSARAKSLSEEIKRQKITDRLDEVKTWTNKIVEDWIGDNNLNRHIIEYFKELDGKKLVNFYLNPNQFVKEINKSLSSLNKSDATLKITREDCDKFYQLLEGYITH